MRASKPRRATIVIDRVHYHPNLIFSVGTQVVTLVDIPGSAGLVLHPRGTVGVVVKSPTDHEHMYRIRFPDGFEAPLKRSAIAMLALYRPDTDTWQDLNHYVFWFHDSTFECVAKDFAATIMPGCLNRALEKMVEIAQGK